MEAERQAGPCPDGWAWDRQTEQASSLELLPSPGGDIQQQCEGVGGHGTPRLWGAASWLHANPQKLAVGMSCR